MHKKHYNTSFKRKKREEITFSIIILGNGTISFKEKTNSEPRDTLSQTIDTLCKNES